MPRRFTAFSLAWLLFALGIAASAEETAEPIAPTQTVKLFNGKDLDGLYTWQKDTKRQDPKNVYTVVDGMIRVSGEGSGYIGTKQAYKDYHLIVEYKWGKHRTNLSKYVRNSGVLLHATGRDGAASGVWMSSIECQLAQGCEGDFILIRGKNKDGKRAERTISSETRIAPDGRTRWHQGGKTIVYSGRQMWWNKHDHEYKELLDTRGRWDVASPLGKWTKVEAICRGNRVTIKINGQTVNECFDVKPMAGKILLQNESYEVFFRRFELRPLEKTP